MKKTLIMVMAVVFAFTACKKDEPETLSGTEWRGSVLLVHEDNATDKEYEYTRYIDLVFSSNTNGTAIIQEVKLPDDITLERLDVPFTYVYEKGKGNITFTPNGEKFDFTINGKILTTKIKIEPSPILYTMEFEKRK